MKTREEIARLTSHSAWSTLLALLGRSGPATQTELSNASGFSQPSVSRALKGLERVGLVTKKKRQAAGAGRPATEWTINREKVDKAFGDW
jgi:predicted ArsR family transcriptional regulator